MSNIVLRVQISSYDFGSGKTNDIGIAKKAPKCLTSILIGTKLSERPSKTIIPRESNNW